MGLIEDHHPVLALAAVAGTQAIIGSQLDALEVDAQLFGVTLEVVVDDLLVFGDDQRLLAGSLIPFLGDGQLLEGFAHTGAIGQHEPFAAFLEGVDRQVGG